MPYISKQSRERLATGLKPTQPGELNYAITTVIKNYIDTVGLSYQAINDVVGALDSAKMEFYRRVASKYEDEAIKRNGDVYK